MKYNTIYIDSEIDGIGKLVSGSGINVQLGEMVSEIQHNYIDSYIDEIGNLGIGSGINVQLGEMVSEIQHYLHLK